MANIFISYRRNEAADVTGRINDRLRQHFGKEAIFTDVDNMPLGVNFRAHLDKEVGQCEVLLAVVGKNWLRTKGQDKKARIIDPNDFVRIEIESALQRDIPVIPLLVQGAKIPTANQLPESLGELAFRHAIKIRPDPEFHTDVDRLISGLNQHLSPWNEEKTQASFLFEDYQKGSKPPGFYNRTKSTVARKLNSFGGGIAIGSGAVFFSAFLLVNLISEGQQNSPALTPIEEKRETTKPTSEQTPSLHKNQIIVDKKAITSSPGNPNTRLGAYGISHPSQQTIDEGRERIKLKIKLTKENSEALAHSEKTPVPKDTHISIKEQNAKTTQWIRAQRPLWYTIELYDGADQQKMEAISANPKFTFQKSEYSYFHHRNNERRYVVVYGAYPTILQARKALQNLPKLNTATEPWVTSIEFVQSLIKRTTTPIVTDSVKVKTNPK